MGLREGLKEWWTGGEKADKARETVARLTEKAQGRESRGKGLKSADQAELARARGVTRRVALQRIGLFTGGAAVAAVPVVSWLLDEGDGGRSVASSAVPAAPAGSLPAAAPIASPVEPSVSAAPDALPPMAESFEVGGFRFNLDAAFSDEEAARIQDILTRACSSIMNYLPEQPDLGKEINVIRVESKASEAGYTDGRLYLNPNSTDGLIVHELVHLLHGKNDLPVFLLEEGFASAISILATNELGMENWDRYENIQINKTLRDGGMSALLQVPYTYYFPLLETRYYFAAQLWLEMERQHPGFIRQYHEEYYKFLREGGDKRAYFGQRMVDTAMRVFPGFQGISSENPLMRFTPDKGTRDLSYAQYVHYKGGERRVKFHLVTKNNDGAEVGRPNVRIDFNLMNLDTGVVSRDLLFNTSETGEAVLDLESPSEGTHFLEQEAGQGSRYKIIFRIGGKVEEFEFDYQ